MHNQHTPGPWKVMADPNHKGKHPFHDCRWIATADAEVETSGFVPMDWGLEKGTLICQMRDQVDGNGSNARLIAAAPELLAALRLAVDTLDAQAALHSPGWETQLVVVREARAAIAKAEGQA